MSPEKPHHSWDETIRTLLIAFLLAIVFRSLAFEPFHIPSGSMKDNLLVGDYLFVSKYTYGYSRYSFPLGLPFFHGRALELNKPKRGDVVVFRLPINPRIDFIKRIMGLPGDHIQVKEGIVYINGEPLRREPDGVFEDSDAPPCGSGGGEEVGVYRGEDNFYRPLTIPRFAETLPEGKVIDILKVEHPLLPGDFDPNNTGIYTVPEGHYFMMGDNRDNSRDSRFLNDVGYVPEENLVGRAEMIFFSTNCTAQWINPVSWFTAIRYNRLFKLIH
ncbi:MAG: signal peptidase I [Pseudomonadota bacterium]|nr:signal peptidase I [Pseudomonadota bacterium]